MRNTICASFNDRIAISETHVRMHVKIQFRTNSSKYTRYPLFYSKQLSSYYTKFTRLNRKKITLIYLQRYIITVIALQTIHVKLILNPT